MWVDEIFFILWIWIIVQKSNYFKLMNFTNAAKSTSNTSSEIETLKKERRNIREE